MYKQLPYSSFFQVPDYNYRAEVKKLIPHLKYLDEVPASQVAIPASRKMSKDWLIVKDSIKEGGLAEDISGLGMSNFPPGPFILSLWEKERMLTELNP